MQPSFLRGVKVTDAKQLVLDALKDKLVCLSTVVHEYPHCWRCKQGLVYRATHQWFCSLHTHGSEETQAGKDEDLVTRSVSAASSSMKFFPPATKTKFVNTLRDPHDWCLSRQRHWGVPLVALHCLNCSHAHVTRKLVDYVAAKMETEGLEWWWKTDLTTFDSGDLFSCPFCDNTDPTKFRKETDVLDVWFDSGSSSVAVCAFFFLPNSKSSSSHSL